MSHWCVCITYRCDVQRPHRNVDPLLWACHLWPPLLVLMVVLTLCSLLCAGLCAHRLLCSTVHKIVAGNGRCEHLTRQYDDRSDCRNVMSRLCVFSLANHFAGWQLICEKLFYGCVPSVWASWVIIVRRGGPPSCWTKKRQRHERRWVVTLTCKRKFCR